MNIPNVFSQICGAALGITDENNEVQNLAASIPSQVVTNYDILASVLSFPLIGILWILLCIFLLSSGGIPDHALPAWLVLSRGEFEGAVGGLAALGREIPLVLLVL